VNRKITPWIIVSMHRPWYNSNKIHHLEAEEMRLVLEPIFYDYKVDVFLTGHVHGYERTHHVYNNKTTHGAPIHIIIGTAGTHEGLWDHWLPEQPSWSVFRTALNWGFNEYTIHNITHFSGIFRDSDTNEIVDQFWIINPFLISIQRWRFTFILSIQISISGTILATVVKVGIKILSIKPI